MYLTDVVPAQKVWVDKTEEKDSDVNPGSRLLRDAYMNRFEVAVLVVERILLLAAGASGS